MISEETRNVAVLKEAYRLWHETKGGSVDHWMDICADELTFGSLGQGVKAAPYMTLYDNKNKLGEYFHGLAREWEMIEFRTEHFVAQVDRVVMLGRCSWRCRRSNRTVWSPKADSFRMANGKIIEFFEYFDTAAMRDALQP